MTVLALVRPAATEADFLAVYNRLLVALREPADDSGVTIGSYFDALKDLPLSALEAGARALMQEPGRRWFPTTAEWRTVATEARQQELRAALSGREEPWRSDCTACDDTGWSYHDCDGTGACGRLPAHDAHQFARICPCRPTNRTWLRHQQASRA